ncbi:9295_t:CDS:2 [Paraglomus brasilianum]|uniref:9295_t:CDS:1 n=1 Tax=Paraglomus brasilianum TaxID=144538 RepID=A0A9N9BJS5_9GLOM|nr:9295_t:CDS:2 [Paraglomus brasilianum]
MTGENANTWNGSCNGAGILLLLEYWNTGILETPRIHCRRRIEDLVFAKTSQGIYCMDCHNEKLNRPRRPREKDNSMKPLYEKSLPSLPTEEKNKEHRKIKPQRSFDSQPSQRHITPKRSTESLNRSLPKPPNSGRRKSRTLDAKAVSDSLRKLSDSEFTRKRSDSLSSSSSSSSHLQAPSLQKFIIYTTKLASKNRTVVEEKRVCGSAFD